MKKLLLAALALALLLPAATAEARCYGCYRGWSVGWGWGGWGWGWGGGWGWGRPYYPYYPGYGRVGWERIPGPAWTVIDTDVSPEHAEVWLDGRYIGVADDFDGHPDYLYLGRGDYKLELRLGGYQTLSLDVKGRPAGYLTIDDWLERLPDTPKVKDGERRVPEMGVQRFWVRKSGQTQVYEESAESEEADARYSADAEVWSRRQEPASPEAAAPAAPGDSASESWRGRPAPAAPAPGNAALLIVVEPPDAAVWVDDRFVGTGADLSSSAKGVPVEPGTHKITVSRPGFGEETVTAEVESGEIRKVRVVLEKD